MENKEINPKSCAHTPIGSHFYDYGKIGFSPCGEYVSHESNKSCAPLPVNESLINLDKCECRAGSCPCGDFVSHRVLEPCTAGEVKKDH